MATLEKKLIIEYIVSFLSFFLINMIVKYDVPGVLSIMLYQSPYHTGTRDMHGTTRLLEFLPVILLNTESNAFHATHFKISDILPYAERLLHMSIPDYRKFAISLILAPYFINIQHLSDKETFFRIKGWLLKCSKVRNLEPSVAYFDGYTRKAIERARNSGIKSLKFEETLKVKNKALYEMLR